MKYLLLLHWYQLYLIPDVITFLMKTTWCEKMLPKYSHNVTPYSMIPKSDRFQYKSCIVANLVFGCVFINFKLEKWLLSSIISSESILIPIILSFLINLKIMDYNTNIFPENKKPPLCRGGFSLIGGNVSESNRPLTYANQRLWRPWYSPEHSRFLIIYKI